MRRRLQMKVAVDAKMRNAAKERLTTSEIENGASAAEGVGVVIAGAVDAATGAVLTEVDETLIDVIHEGQDRPRLDVETHEIEDHFVVPHPHEISIPTFQVAEITAEEMNHAVDRLRPLCHQDIPAPDHARLFDVDAARIQHPYHHILDVVPHPLREIVVGIVAEVVEVEEGVQTVVIVGDHIHLPIALDLDLRQLASEEEALQSP